MRLVLRQKKVKQIKENGPGLQKGNFQVKLRPLIFLKLTFNEQIYNEIYTFVMNNKILAQGILSGERPLSDLPMWMDENTKKTFIRAKDIYNNLDLTIPEHMPSLSLDETATSVEVHTGRARMLAAYVKYGEDTKIVTNIETVKTIPVLPTELKTQYGKEFVELRLEKGDIVYNRTSDTAVPNNMEVPVFIEFIRKNLTLNNIQGIKDNNVPPNVNLEIVNTNYKIEVTKEKVKQEAYVYSAQGIGDPFPSYRLWKKEDIDELFNSNDLGLKNFFVPIEYSKIESGTVTHNIKLKH